MKMRDPSISSQIDESIEQSVGINVRDLTALYVLASLKGFGPQKFKELHEKGLRAHEVINHTSRLPIAGKRGEAFRAQLESTLKKQLPVCRERAVRQILTAQKHHASILTYGHRAYPRNVFESNNPVPILYVRGSLRVLENRNAVACVGSREVRLPYTELHKAFCRIGCELGFAIVSGFALGADTIGHATALECGGQTICVMPAGLDRPFPPENTQLWTKLLSYSGAALVSEFSFGTGASSLTLRKRNKLIVAFARGVLVTQSSVDGGAMNAYRFAIEQRKPLATFAPDEGADTSGNALIGQRVDIDSKVFPVSSPDRKVYEQWLRELSSST